jgi:hypothetical protein
MPILYFGFGQANIKSTLFVSNSQLISVESSTKPKTNMLLMRTARFPDRPCVDLRRLKMRATTERLFLESYFYYKWLI